MVKLGRIAFVLAFAAAALMGVAATGAGGWASVRLAEGEPEAVLGQPWNATLIVKGHDIEPIDVDEVSVRFSHPDSSSTLDVAAAHAGKTGHYALTVTFDKPGIWNWTATPAPYPPISMASLTVYETSAGLDLGGPSVKIVMGTCESPGAELHNAELEPASRIGETEVTTAVIPKIDPFVEERLTEAVSVTVWDPKSGRVLACGPLPTSPVTEAQVIPLEARDGSQTTGTLTLVPQADGVLASIVVVANAGAPGVEIRIIDLSEGMFQPQSITIPAGTAVTWVNESAIAHTVSSNDAGFANSGMLDPGASFTQTFDIPGTYTYLCDPHNWMTGTITVTG